MSHVQKPTFMNQISLGNVLSALGIIGAGIAVYAAMHVQLATAATNTENLKDRLDRVEHRMDRQLEQINAKLDRLIERRD